MSVLRLHKRIWRTRFLKENRVTTLRTAHTISKIVVSVKPSNDATATNGMVDALSHTNRTIGAKKMDISSPAAMVRKRLCILKNIFKSILWVCRRKNREKSEIFSIFDTTLKALK